MNVWYWDQTKDEAMVTIDDVVLNDGQPREWTMQDEYQLVEKALNLGTREAIEKEFVRINDEKKPTAYATHKAVALREMEKRLIEAWRTAKR